MVDSAVNDKKDSMRRFTNGILMLVFHFGGKMRHLKDKLKAFANKIEISVPPSERTVRGGESGPVC